MCCFKTMRAQIFIVLSVFIRCFLDKRAHGLESGKISVYKCFFRVIFHYRGPQASIIKLEWWVQANVWKKPEVRDDLTMIGTPKTFVSKHGGSWKKLSLWPFCGWIPRPTKAIWATFDYQRMQSVQYFDGRIGWLDTYKKTYEIEVGGPPFRWQGSSPRIPFGYSIRNLQVCKHCSNLMVIAQSAERLTRIFLSERKGIGLKFAANVHFWIQNFLVCFLLLSYEVKTGIFGFAAEKTTIYNGNLEL